MNFLAHFHLAWPDQALIAGGLEGDYFKGPLPGTLPPQLAQGVRLHRQIDAYTDSHPIVKSLRQTLPEPLRRYAGILIDLCFDHFLTLHWSRFSSVPLRQFSDRIYEALKTHDHQLSEGARVMAARLARHDVLVLFEHWDTVIASAERTGERFKRENPFRNIDQHLSPEKEKLEHAFLNFYPDLQSFSLKRDLS